MKFNSQYSSESSRDNQSVHGYMMRKSAQLGRLNNYRKSSSSSNSEKQCLSMKMMGWILVNYIAICCFYQHANAQEIKAMDVFTGDGDKGYDNYDDRCFYMNNNKQFIETLNKRCGLTTVLKDPAAFEPEFVFVKRNGYLKLAASASPSEITNAGFDPKKKTMILVHGYRQTFDSYVAPWLFAASEHFTDKSLQDHYNMFIMDWGKAANEGGYVEVVGRVNAVSDFLTTFLTKLTDDLGTDRMRVHLIGFSLGAHVVGLTGKRMKPQIGRITGLDPAGPCFGKFKESYDHERLSADDAYEVDVFHTDDSLFGRHPTQGQFDVYINGGALQPDCGDNISNMFEGVITAVTKRNRSFSPSHTRSCQIATVDLVNTHCQHVAYECSSYKAFIRGECGHCDETNNQCFFMGLPFQYEHPIPNFNAPLRTTNGVTGKKFFIRTGSDNYLCLLHTQFLVHILPKDDADQLEWDKWKFELEVENRDHAVAWVLVKHKVSARLYSHLLLTEGQPAQIHKAKLRIRDRWNRRLSIKEWPVKVRDIEINFMSNYDYKQRQALSSRLCPSPTVDKQQTKDKYAQFEMQYDICP